VPRSFCFGQGEIPRKNIWITGNPQSSELANDQPRAKAIADYYTNDHAGEKTDLHHLNAPPYWTQNPLMASFREQELGPPNATLPLPLKPHSNEGKLKRSLFFGQMCWKEI
jgi:hypothetical protein